MGVIKEYAYFYLRCFLSGISPVWNNWSYIILFFLVYNYPEISFPKHTKEYLYLDDLYILSY